MPKRSHICGGITSAPEAPASTNAWACSTASLIPSQQMPETTGARPFACDATMRVISARSFRLSANTSPARFVFLTSEAAKARLIPNLPEQNQEKARTAPVVALGLTAFPVEAQIEEAELFDELVRGQKSATPAALVERLRARFGIERVYGLELVDSSNGTLKRGSVYVILSRMEAKGFVESRQEERQPGAIGLPRRLYRATEYGIKVHDAYQLLREALALRPEEAQ